MRRAPVVFVAFLVAVAASWCLLLLWAADVDWRAPWSPTVQRTFAGSEFHAVFGAGAAQRGQLHVRSAAEDFSSLQSTALTNVDATAVPILRYRFADFPRTLELSLVFRTAENPGDVQSISLPWPGDGVSTFDLSRVAAWRGGIVELGFAEFPTAQLVPPASGFRPFSLVRAQLESPSWRGRFATMLTSWLTHYPWQLISVSAVGPTEVGDTSPHAPRLPLVFALALLPVGAFAWLILRLRGAALRRLMLAGTCVAWFAGDLLWQRDLAWKRATDQDIWGALPFAERQDHVADADVRAWAEHLKTALQKEPRTTRVLINATSVHDVLRFIYFAAPLNIASFGNLAGVDVDHLPPGVIVVTYGDPVPVPVKHVLRVGTTVLHIDTLERGTQFAMYRIKAASR
jgi:hypothetical protein